MLSNVERLANATSHRVEIQATARIARNEMCESREIRRDARALANKSENLGLPGAEEARARAIIADAVYANAQKVNKKACKNLQNAASTEKYLQEAITNREKNQAAVARYDAAISNNRFFLGVAYDESSKIVDFDMGGFGLYSEENAISVRNVNELDIFIASLSAIADKMRA